MTPNRVFACSYNLYGANKDTKAVFSDVQRFLRYANLPCQTVVIFIMLLVFVKVAGSSDGTIYQRLGFQNN
jgi:hypothetical protein